MTETDNRDQTVTLEQALELAVQHHGAGRLREAESIYVQVLQAVPDEPVALHLHGVLAHQKGENDIAVERISRALEILPDYAEAHNNLGNVLQAMGKPEEAAASYRKALQIEPDYGDAHNNLGMALKDLGRLDEAADSLEKALAINPRHAGAHNNLGLVRKQQDRLDEAIACYRSALRADPDFAAAHNNLGMALREQGALDEAADSHRKALAINPRFSTAHSNLGLVYKEQDRLAEAAASFEDALAIDPGTASVHNFLGIALKDQGLLEESLVSYRNALAINPDYAAAHGNLGNALLELGRIEPAIESYRRALAIDRDYADAYKGLGLGLHYQGRMDEAKQSYSSGIALDPTPGIANVGLMRIRIDQGEVPLPVCALPEDQHGNEAAHPGLRVWNRPVESELRDLLYRLATISPEKEINSNLRKYQHSAGIREGNMFFSDTYRLMDRDDPAIQRLKTDLMQTLTSMLQADLFFCDSFFNLYHAGSTVNPHNHVHERDRTLGFAGQKYSLIYYVEAGEKSAAEPGILKLLDPDYAVNPQTGDIVLIPSSSDHATSYSGTSDRIILGVNFYTI